MKFRSLYNQCKKVNTSYFLVLFKLFYFKLRYKQNFFLSKRVYINGAANITVNGNLKIGLFYVGFMHKNDLAYLNISGKLNFKGNYSIAKGCRVDIGKHAVVNIGNNGYMSANVLMVVMNGLTIGDNCSIGWNTQFLDEDFHTLDYPEKKSADNNIVVGNNVWIGCNCFIYKGSRIPDGSVVAAYSIVKGVFNEDNVLLAGNPARLVKRNISWN